MEVSSLERSTHRKGALNAEAVLAEQSAKSQLFCVAVSHVTSLCAMKEEPGPAVRLDFTCNFTLMTTEPILGCRAAGA